MIAIEKNVPVPERNKTRGRKYPFAEMEIGDSFVIPIEDPLAGERLFKSVCAAYWRFKPKKFTSRKENGNIRVWRIE